MNIRNNSAISAVLGSAGIALIFFFGAAADAREPIQQSAVIGKPFPISASVKEYCKS